MLFTRMRLRAALLSFAAASLTWTAPSLAVNPMDDDAGSGGDAGDFPSEALFIRSGTFRGTLGHPHDLTDYFAFEGLEGQWLHLSLQAQARASMSLYWPDDAGLLTGGLHDGGVSSGSRSTDLLTKDGRWLLALTLSPAVYNSHVDYEFEISLSEPAQWVLLGGQQAYEVAEIVLSGPTRFVLSSKTGLDEGARGAPFAGLTFKQWDVRFLDQHWRSTGIGIYAGSGRGEGVAIQPLGVSYPLGLPGLPEVETAKPFGDGGLWTRTDFVSHDIGVEGGLRVGYLAAGADAVIAFSADRPFVVRTASGDEATLWSEFNSGSDVAAVIPAASIVGPRTLALEVEGLVFGAFSPWAYDGDLEEPSGSVVALDFFDRAYLEGATDGRWTFRLNATAGAGNAASFPYLLAGQIPTLGLLPDWRDGMQVSRFPLPAPIPTPLGSEGQAGIDVEHASMVSTPRANNDHRFTTALETRRRKAILGHSLSFERLQSKQPAKNYY